MLDEVRQAFLEEKRYQEMNGLKCKATVDGYTDVIRELKQREFDNLQEKMNRKKYKRNKKED